jgi:hypothetical protein
MIYRSQSYMLIFYHLIYCFCRHTISFKGV